MTTPQTQNQSDNAIDAAAARFAHIVEQLKKHSTPAHA